MIGKFIFVVIACTFVAVSADADAEATATEPFDPTNIPVDPNGNKLKHRFQGAQQVVDLNNFQQRQQIQQMANLVVTQMNKNSNCFYAYGLVNIVSATVQMGCTSCYVITITVGQSYCQNNPFNPPQVNQCQINPNTMCQCVVNVVQQQCNNCMQPQLNIGYNCQQGVTNPVTVIQIQG